MKVSNSLKSLYTNFYSEDTEKWRKLGAVEKVNNIVAISNEYKFNSVIEVGAGDGNILLELSSKNFANKYTATEISKSGVEQINKKNINNLEQVVLFDGYSLPFADNEFDVAICTHVLEHVEHPRILLKEISRVSKHQIFEVPIDFSLMVDKKFKHFESYGHINIYTPALFNFLLYSENFNVINKCYKMYSYDIINFQYKNKPLKKCVAITKLILWNTFCFLRKIKPNTYTVLTSINSLN